MTLGEHLTMAAPASMFYIATDHKNKTNMKASIAASQQYKLKKTSAIF